ncbi:unnamed protein product [Meganyctiphanes norvegica]|uniref:Uncharacterized protein n=1 Tax=Meganyctiphanes norvegica TaxID=48144 RepID=A0AAV2Q3Y5_MEGNR
MQVVQQQSGWQHFQHYVSCGHLGQRQQLLQLHCTEQGIPLWLQQLQGYPVPVQVPQGQQLQGQLGHQEHQERKGQLAGWCQTHGSQGDQQHSAGSESDHWSQCSCRSHGHCHMHHGSQHGWMDLLDNRRSTGRAHPGSGIGSGWGHKELHREQHSCCMLVQRQLSKLQEQQHSLDGRCSH